MIQRGHNEKQNSHHNKEYRSKMSLLRYYTPRGRHKHLRACNHLHLSISIQKKHHCQLGKTQTINYA